MRVEWLYAKASVFHEAREQVDGSDLLGNPLRGRETERGERDAEAEADLLGEPGEMTEEHLGGRAMRASLTEVVLDRPDGVEPDLVGEPDLLDRLAVSAPFGAHSDAEWSVLTEHVTRRQPDGSYRMHYDPAIAVPFNAAAPDKDIELWSYYDAIRCPTLVIRGALSDLLKRETVREMAGRGPRAKTVEIPEVGHAPTLMHADQIAIVRDFLLGN